MKIRSSQRQGVALIIVLSFIVIVTGVIIAFFSRATLGRQISRTSVAQIQSKTLADTALNTLIGDLRAEIAAGSTGGPSPAPTAPVPKLTVFPPRDGNTISPATSNGALKTTHPNFLKRSKAGELFFPSTASYDISVVSNFTLEMKSRASVAGPTPTPTTLISSKNGRYVNFTRWSKPKLFNSSTALTTDQVPDWVYITRSGVGLISDTTSANFGKVITNADLPALRPAKYDNVDYVLGRFAYMMYDVSGLLDINVAGNALSGDENRRRGRLHQARLENVIGASGKTAVVAWRNPITGTTTGMRDNTGELFDPKRDFISVGALRPAASPSPSPTALPTPTGWDRAFVSRQDLLAYAAKNPAHIDDTALPRLTTFTREKNAPSATNAFSSAGVPLLKQRFPLSRLALFEDRVANAGDINKYFGLTWSGTYWSYRGGTGSILALTAISGREPDFFEVLKAAISRPGVTLGFGASQSDGSNPEIHLNADYHIMKIGANIIDQYDSDNFPTDIFFPIGSNIDPISTFNHVFGIEDVPYITRVFGIGRIGRNATMPDEYTTYFLPEVWAPHQSLSSPISADVTGSYRIRLVGRGRSFARNPANRVGHLSQSAAVDFSQGGTITLDSSTINSSFPPLPVVTAGLRTAPRVLGDYSAGFALPTHNPTGPSELLALAPADREHGIEPSSHLAFILEYDAGSNDWRPYSIWNTISGELVVVDGDEVAIGSKFYGGADSRTDRFGVGVGSVTAATGSQGGPNATIRTGDAAGLTLDYLLRVSASGGTSNNPGDLSTNKTIMGVAPDGSYAASGVGYPLHAGNSIDSSSRPLVLNRPFRSVGELGYAFRDVPFSSLDFFTPDSPDSALIDFFSIDDAPVVAGRVNPNAGNQAVLAAILEDAIVKDALAAAGVSTYTPGEATNLAQSIVAHLATPANRLIHRSDVVKQLGGTMMEASGFNALSGSKMTTKTEREGMVRALADVANTRTWNLMIDMIVQSGRLPTAGAASDTLASAFMVQGEQRYWVHLAIDRFTGEIVDQQIEVVKE